MTGPVRVLLVDDDPEEQLVVQGLLDDTGTSYEVMYAPSYDAALQALSHGVPDAALIDYRLGTRTGLELIAVATAEGSDVPLILLTGQGDATADRAAMRAGAVDYLDKVGLTGGELDRTLRYAITQRLALLALREREERIRALLEHSSDLIVLLNRRGRIDFASQASDRVLGVDPEALIGQRLFALVASGDRPRLQAAFDEVLARPALPVQLEYSEQRDGRRHDFEVTFVNRIDVSAVRGVVTTIRDITARKRAEIERAHLAAIVTSSRDAIVGTTLDGVIVSWNGSAERLYGHAAAEMIGQLESRLIPPHLEGTQPSNRARIAASEGVHYFEAVRRTKAGALVQVHCSVSPIMDAGGAVVGVSTTSRDITAQAQAEDALRESRERMEFALAAAGIGVWDFDLDSGALSWTDSMAPVMGMARERFPTTWQEFLALVHFEDRDAVTAALAPRARGPERREVQYRLQQEESLTWHVSRAKVHHRNGHRCLIGVSADVTESKRLEGQFVQAQKMDAVGRLAAGVAHDFNNLLTVIQGYSDLAVYRLASSHDAVGDIDEVRAAAKTAEGLTRQLLLFSRKQLLELRSVDLNTLVSRMQSLLRRLIGEDIALDTRLGANLPAVRVDVTQVEQVILNLCVNARDAMSNGGHLVIETASVDLDATFAARHAGIEPGPHVLLSVSDTGTGMDETTQSRLFEPFFTTKEQGKGTGLGLATVYGIVKQSHGTIWVDTEVGVGTTFKIYLPSLGTPAGDLAPAEIDTTRLTGSETILVVEDEEGVRALTVEALRLHGYTVLSTSGPQEAVELSREYEGRIHLLLTDVVMPGGNGVDLARTVVDSRPATRVLFMSGYTDDALGRHGILTPGISLIQKPFSITALLMRVREVVDRVTT